MAEPEVNGAGAAEGGEGTSKNALKKQVRSLHSQGS